VFSVIALRRKALFSSPSFPRFFKAVHAQFYFVGGDQVEMKMILKKDLVPDMHCLLINITKVLLAFKLNVKHINQVT